MSLRCLSACPRRSKSKYKHTIGGSCWRNCHVTDSVVVVVRYLLSSSLDRADVYLHRHHRHLHLVVSLLRRLHSVRMCSDRGGGGGALATLPLGLTSRWQWRRNCYRPSSSSSSSRLKKTTTSSRAFRCRLTLHARRQTVGRTFEVWRAAHIATTCWRWSVGHGQIYACGRIAARASHGRLGHVFDS